MEEAEVQGLFHRTPHLVVQSVPANHHFDSGGGGAWVNSCRHTGLLLASLRCLKLFIPSSFPSLANGEWFGSSRSWWQPEPWWVRAEIPTWGRGGRQSCPQVRGEPQPRRPRQARALPKEPHSAIPAPCAVQEAGTEAQFLSHFCLYRSLRMLSLSEAATENPSRSLTSSGFPQIPRWTYAEISPILKQTVAK